MSNLNAAVVSTCSEQFASFTRAMRYEDLAPELLSKIKLCVLDQIGVQLVGATLPWTRVVYDYACSIAANGPCTVVGTPSAFSAPEAAFVNATFGHSCEFDDVGHAGVAVIPAALAVSQQINATGREFLTAVALGYEVFFRIWAAVMPQILERGFHQQTVVGVFASAAVAGRLFELTHEQLVHAFGIAGSHASATAEYDQSGGEVKRMHAGLGARGGLQSAMLARLGLTGPRQIFEGKRGIFHTFVDYARQDRVITNLGRQFVFPESMALKIYPTVASIHTSIDALGQLMEMHGITAADVSSIRVGVREYTLAHGASIEVPTDVLGSQFSLAFSLALRLVMGGNDLRFYLDESLWSDPRIVEVAKKVQPYADPSALRDRITGSRVTVEVRDGRTFEHYVQYRKGTAQNPASDALVRKKFRALAGSVIDPGKIERIIDLVDGLERAAGVGTLASLLGVNSNARN